MCQSLRSPVQHFRSPGMSGQHIVNHLLEIISKELPLRIASQPCFTSLLSMLELQQLSSVRNLRGPWKSKIAQQRSMMCPKIMGKGASGRRTARRARASTNFCRRNTKSILETAPIGLVEVGPIEASQQFKATRPCCMAIWLNIARSLCCVPRTVRPPWVKTFVPVIG